MSDKLPPAVHTGERVNALDNARGKAADRDRPRAAGDALDAIVCPLTLREVPQALANFERWSTRYVPFSRPEREDIKPRLVFSFNCGENEEARAALQGGFDSNPKAASCFSALEIIFLDLPPEKDLYIRKPSGRPPPFGNKSGPNWMFFETCQALKDTCEFVFLMETDCVPVVNNWISRLRNVCKHNSRAWVIGAHYSGASPLSWHIARHINGNALYHVGDPEFISFLETQLWPWMHEHIRVENPNIAYDCAWETFLNRAEMDYPGHSDWATARSVLHKFVLTDTIVNIGGDAEQAGKYFWTRGDLLNRFSGAAVVHGPVHQDSSHRRGLLSVGRIGSRPVAPQPNASWSEPKLNEHVTTVWRSFWRHEGSLETGDAVVVRYTVEGSGKGSLVATIRDPVDRVLASRKSAEADHDGRSLQVTAVLQSNQTYLLVEFARPEEESGELTLSKVEVVIRREGRPVGRLTSLFSSG